MRFIGLDVHRDFCEVAIAEAGEVRLAGRVQTEPEALALFAQSLGSDDELALEVTGNALEIARIIAPHVARVVLANPKVDAPASELDEEEHVEPLQPDGLDREEVDGDHALRVSAQEVAPGKACPLAGGA